MDAIAWQPAFSARACSENRFPPVSRPPCSSHEAWIARELRVEVSAQRLALVVEGRNDIEAADVLGELASLGAGNTDIAGELISRLHASGCAADARCRLTQALAEIPGAEVDESLRGLTGDSEQSVSRTAKAVLTMRGTE